MVEQLREVYTQYVVVPAPAPHPPPTTDCPIDIVFVLDSSGSILSRNYDLMKSFLSRLVGKLDIDSAKTRVGLVTFASTVGTVINLNAHSSVASIQSAISSLTYTGGLTETAVALAYVRTTMLTSSAGARNNVPKVVVILTDGRSSNRTATQVSELFVSSHEHCRNVETFIAERTNGCAHAIVLCLYVCCLYGLYCG